MKRSTVNIQRDVERANTTASGPLALQIEQAVRAHRGRLQGEGRRTDRRGRLGQPSPPTTGDGEMTWEGDGAPNMPFYQTNPPFLPNIFSVKSNAQSTYDQNLSDKSVGL